MNNNSKSTLTGKIAETFMKIGDVHAKEYSIILNYYEPEVSLSLLENTNSDEK
ncbi:MULTISPECIES: hypothetical protein [Clostridium]|uniref:Uncharacterized protein n=1 Tax=Clostridium cibarium TaxID=2762247 RepID=A0ABR8PSR7_9CLOT|nr:MULTISPECIES: hypothetical protein [Clostridium]MBD7911170.1 hypothetical protein [Clostridium cibarium]